jgi:hypothetical protein
MEGLVNGKMKVKSAYFGVQCSLTGVMEDVTYLHYRHCHKLESFSYVVECHVAEDNLNTYLMI